MDSPSEDSDYNDDDTGHDETMKMFPLKIVIAMVMAMVIIMLVVFRVISDYREQL